jgi:sigma-B regulation protein RsbU (phosphoserine phosphatase)
MTRSRAVCFRELVNWGYEVSVTEEGSSAWDRLQRSDAPALAILDVMMPEMDGLEICRRVRRQSPTIPPYLILLTAMSSKADVVKGIEAGANDYLIKPFHRDELKVRVGVGVQILNLQRSLTERVHELEEALSQVKQLQGLLPICSYCKKIRDDQNYWQQVDSYLSAKTEVQFSHGICPECYEQVAAELAERRQKESASP